MPLGQNLLISLYHKKKYAQDKGSPDTIKQGAPQSTLAGASLTLEAALVFPLFLFVMVTVLSFFRVLQVGHVTYGALTAAGSQLSIEAREETEPTVKAPAYFQKELLAADFPDSFVTGGRGGISFSGTSLKGDYVDLKIQYRCRLPITLFGVGDIPIAQRVRMKKWNGFQKGKAEGEGAKDPIVYITPNGTVYHSSYDCTHLRLSTRTMGKGLVSAAGYAPCLFCGDELGLYSYYYVTEEGRKYHTRLSCSGLKRTVYMVRLSEAQGRTPCSRCGGV